MLFYFLGAQISLGGCFTHVLHSSKNYHQEHATEPRRLPKDVVAAWGVSNL